jgi:hypothetical protein
MAWLQFSRGARRIELYAGKNVGQTAGTFRGMWLAHNDVARHSLGTWPDGTYAWSHCNDHIADQNFLPGCFSTAYGCYGIHVFATPNLVPIRSGLGVHAGRTRRDTPWWEPGTLTMGCIRVPEDAMTVINQTHHDDPLVRIVVES